MPPGIFSSCSISLGRTSAFGLFERRFAAFVASKKHSIFDLALRLLNEGLKYIFPVDWSIPMKYGSSIFASSSLS